MTLIPKQCAVQIQIGIGKCTFDRFDNEYSWRVRKKFRKDGTFLCNIIAGYVNASHKIFALKFMTKMIQKRWIGIIRITGDQNRHNILIK